MNIVGIDPGLDGAIALLRDGELCYVKDMPVRRVGPPDARGRVLRSVDPMKTYNVIRNMDADRIIIELPIYLGGNAAQSVGKTGEGWGIVYGLCSILAPTITVRAATWKVEMDVSALKSTSLALARRLWPDKADEFFSRKMDHGRAEAALIARYLNDT